MNDLYLELRASALDSTVTSVNLDESKMKTQLLKHFENIDSTIKMQVMNVSSSAWKCAQRAVGIQDIC